MKDNAPQSNPAKTPTNTAQPLASEADASKADWNVNPGWRKLNDDEVEFAKGSQFTKDEMLAIYKQCFGEDEAYRSALE